MNDLKLTALPLHARLAIARDEEPRVIRITLSPNAYPPSQQALLCSPRM